MSGTTAMSSAGTKSFGTNVLSNLANFLPTGTFLAFQSLAPLFSDSGSCGTTEKIMTGILITMFTLIDVFLAFTDSIRSTSGKLYYGVVTSRGLYNPQFEGSCLNGVQGSFYNKEGSNKYKVNLFDYLHGFLTAITFVTLATLTPPVSDCFWKGLSQTIIKTVPILVGILAAGYFSLVPPPRRGIGYSPSEDADIATDENEPADAQMTTTAPSPAEDGTTTASGDV